MIKIIIGFIHGLAVATVGFGGLATMADNGVNSAKTAIAQQATQKSAQSVLSEMKAEIDRELAKK